MRKVFKKTIASVVAGVTLAVGMTAMSSSAYWATKNIYNSDGNAVGEAYNSVSSTTFYAKTTKYNPNYTMSMYMNYVVGNHDTSRDEAWESNNKRVLNIRWHGTDFSSGKSTHSVNGNSTSIVMNVGG